MDLSLSLSVFVLFVIGILCVIMFRYDIMGWFQKGSAGESEGIEVAVVIQRIDYKKNELVGHTPFLSYGSLFKFDYMAFRVSAQQIRRFSEGDTIKVVVYPRKPGEQEGEESPFNYYYPENHPEAIRHGKRVFWDYWADGFYQGRCAFFEDIEEDMAFIEKHNMDEIRTIITGSPPLPL